VIRQMMTDYRALCEQLMELAEGKRYDGSAVIAKARAALAQPEPPSLKEQALNDLDTIQTHDSFGFQIIDLSNIRCALEAIND
jgi:hypothetical protein